MHPQYAKAQSTTVITHITASISSVSRSGASISRSVRGMAGFRIVLDGKKVGALDLFSDTPGKFDAHGAQGAVLASFASVALVSVANQERAESLRRGLESNREVGKAIGLMMAAHQIGSDEAFELLRRASNDMNMKLTEVAREVIDNAERRPVAES